MLFGICFAIVWLFCRPLFPTKVIGKKKLPKEGGYVLVCNHYSNMDCIILDLCLVKKLRFLAKKELFKNKFVSYFLKKFGGYPINRDKPDISAFKFSIDVLRKKKVLAIFPEGTRNKNEEAMKDLKFGAVTFASRGNAQIVPVVLYRKPKIFRRNYILIGDPIDLVGENPSKLTKEEVEMNAQNLYDTMQQIRADFEQKKNKKKARNKNGEKESK